MNATDGTTSPEPMTPPEPTTLRDRLRGRSELGVCALLLVLGILVLTDAVTMDTDFAQRGPVGPHHRPASSSGTLLLLVAVLLAVDVLRGGRGEAEGGEDVDLDRARRLAHRRPPRRRLPRQRRPHRAARLPDLRRAPLLGLRVRARQPQPHPRPADRGRAVPGHLPGLQQPAGRPAARRPADGGAVTDGLPELPPRRLRYGTHPAQPAVGRHRRAARHRHRRAARHRPGDGGGAAAARHLRTRPHRRVHHVRRHLLRRHVRRLHHLDPAQHPGRERGRGRRHRGQPDGQGRARRPGARGRRHRPLRRRHDRHDPAGRARPDGRRARRRHRRARLLRHHGPGVHRGDLRPRQLPHPRLRLPADRPHHRPGRAWTR